MFLLGYIDAVTDGPPHFPLMDMPPQADGSCCGVVVLSHIINVRRGDLDMYDHVANHKPSYVFTDGLCKQSK